MHLAVRSFILARFCAQSEWLWSFYSHTVTESEVDYFFHVYSAMDKDGSGGIAPREFFAFFELERSPYTERVYRVMGT